MRKRIGHANLLFSCAIQLLAVTVAFDARISTAAPQLRNKATPKVADGAIQQFNETILKCIADGDPGSMEELMDWLAMEQKITSGIQCHPEVRSKFLKKAKSEIVQKWVRERHQVVSHGGNFQFRRVVTSNGRQQAVYRMISGDGGANYYGIEISPDAKGKLRITDLTEISRATTFCETSHFMLRFLADAIGMQIGAEPTPEQLKSLKPVQQIQELQQAVEQGQGSRALKIYKSLPATLAGVPEVQYYRLRAAIQVEPGGDEHRLAVENLLSQMKDPIARRFLELNYHAANKDGVQSAREGNEIQSLLGPDAWIDTEIANSFLMQGDPGNARKYVANAIKSEPDFWLPYSVDLHAAAMMADFEAAANALRNVDRLKPLPNLRGIEGNPKLANFVMSDAYKKWKDDRLLAEQEKQKSLDQETISMFEDFEEARGNR